jgi:Protein of unknown function (DUF2510)
VGLIRKSLMLGSAGLIRGSSKKQRVARAQLNHEQREAAQQRWAERDQRIVARTEHIPAPTGTHRERMEALDRIRAAANGAQGVEASQRKWAAIQQNLAQPIAAAPALPPQGWYADPDREHLLRSWDGADWTDRTAPRV